MEKRMNPYRIIADIIGILAIIVIAIGIVLMIAAAI
jgi:uncharacterized membrane protein